jgi:hypothetical protein
MAIAITFFATVFFLPKEKWIFLLWILMASLFHYSAAVTVIFVFFDRKFYLKWILVALVCLLFLVFTGLNQKLSGYLDLLSYLKENYSAYFHDKKIEPYHFSINTIFGIGRRILPVLLLVYYRSALKGNKYYNIIFNVSLFTLFLYIFGINNSMIFITRILLYFSIYEAVVFSWILSMPIKKYKWLVYSSIFIYGILIFAKVINDSYPTYIFIPYKTIFFTF